MKNRCFARFVSGSLLALLPVFLFAGPWDPNRARPRGFQRTLGYLANDLVNYPDAQLQSIRGKILSDDLVSGVIAGLQSSGIPPSNWEAEGQKAYDAYNGQYQQLKTLTRQTMTDPEGIIQAVEGNQPLSAELAGHDTVRALIAVRWQMLNVAEQTYQALLYTGATIGPGRPSPPTDIGPPKPGKSKDRIDWERMRESRRRAIERRREWEARWAEEARRRNAEIDELIRYLRNYGSLSNNKFRSTRPGAGSGGYVSDPAPAAPEPATTEPAGEPAPTIEEIEEIEEEIEQLAEKIEAEESTKVEKAKVKVYRGTLILRRPTGLDDPSWQKVKDAVIAAHAQAPELTDMADKGDEVTWRYKTLTLPQSSALIEVVPDGEPTEEEVDGAPASKKEKEEPKFVGNGDYVPTDEKIIPGTEEKTVEAKPKAKPAPKPAPKPEPKKTEVVMHDGYWFDPTDESRDDDDPFIYVRVNGVAKRIELSKAPAAYGVPDGLTIDQMSHYNERLRKLEKNYNNSHRSKGANSINKFAKPGS